MKSKKLKAPPLPKILYVKWDGVEDEPWIQASANRDGSEHDEIIGTYELKETSKVVVTTAFVRTCRR